MAQKIAQLATEHTDKIFSFTPKKRTSLYFQEYCEQLIEHMAAGYSFESFARDIGVSKQTLYNWCSLYPEFAEAKDIGNEKSRKVLEEILLTTARTGKGSYVSAFFLLKNRFPNEWRDKKEIEVAKEETKHLTLDEQIQRVDFMRAELLRLKAGEDMNTV